MIVANAGRGLGGSVKDADLSQFQDVLNINVTGTLFLIQTEDIANAIQYIVQQPPHVHVNDIMIRSTRQDYP